MSHDMGMGKLGDSEMVFVRKFRFLLSGEHLEPWYMNSAKYDLVMRVLEIRGYEIATPEGVVPINNWVEDMLGGKYPNETLTLITLDGCGNELYKRTFKGLKLLNVKNSFDMSSIAEGNTDIVIGFESCEYKDGLNSKQNWEDRPHGPVEISYLNAETTIP